MIAEERQVDIKLFVCTLPFCWICFYSTGKITDKKLKGSVCFTQRFSLIFIADDMAKLVYSKNTKHLLGQFPIGAEFIHSVTGSYQKFSFPRNCSTNGVKILATRRLCL